MAGGYRRVRAWRELDNTTLEEVLSIIVRAHQNRRTDPTPWRLIANQVRFIEDSDARAEERSGEAGLRRQVDELGLGKEGA
jgi:hypothetical protein